MNYGGGGGEVHVHLTVNTIDKDGFAEFLSRTGGAEIRKFIVRARSEGAW